MRILFLSRIDWISEFMSLYKRRKLGIELTNRADSLLFKCLKDKLVIEYPLFLRLCTAPLLSPTQRFDPVESKHMA
ncbi:hypothetical protein BpHYR1_022831 [Brachionus plicatilis]|uniref:Uncharacterized protein n=1 Tax=Brachionus plicatilis TaxID=10195 RepID=A0A3M7QHT0_BRAPC|nr:hypothetical protein BpHYR1_022831 [Brachionus plicatilis]